MKTCDVCGNKLGIMNKFKYADGHICKICYKKASRQFTETITQKSLMEIEELCNRKRDEGSFERFEITGKVGNYLLIDEKNQRLCIPNNRMTNQKVSDPEFYDIKDIKKCEIQFSPEISLNELEQRVLLKKDESVINFLNVCITMKDGKQKIIQLLSKPVRIKSYAFRQSFHFAKRINEEIRRFVGMEI
ncbi:MAG: DUF4428 domain-containing protein [Lachnospiraceae bacterium]|nr:DUF4428 domain-containing protein [Lachnospiraceae bacterium]